MARDRARSEALGRRAESFAAWALRLKGYRIVARRFRGPGGEVDLIARRGRLLVFIEVKARADLAGAQASVDERQRRRIVAAAGAFLARNPAFAGFDLRFDFMAVAPWRWPYHLPDAWRP